MVQSSANKSKKWRLRQMQFARNRKNLSTQEDRIKKKAEQSRPFTSNLIFVFQADDYCVKVCR